MKKLISNVENWAVERNIVEGSDPSKQFLKLVEELGELAEGICTRNTDLAMDGAGDVAVVAIIMAKQYNKELNFSTKVHGSKSSGEPSFPTLAYRRFALTAASIGAIGGVLARGNAKPETMQSLLSLVMEHLVQLTHMLGTSLEACLEMAWNEIKHRKGRMVDGVFVKEEDLPPPAEETEEAEEAREPKGKKKSKSKKKEEEVISEENGESNKT